MNTELRNLYKELDDVKNSDLKYLPKYGYQRKDDIIQLTEEDIEELENEIYSYTDEELEEERTSLCMSLGISRFC